MTDIEGLKSKLITMFSHRGNGLPTQYVNPDGKEAVAAIEVLQAEITNLRAELILAKSSTVD